MSETPKRIHLLGDGRVEEAIAAGAITPGHLITLDANSKVVVHATAGGWAEHAFALEDALQGRSITTAYANAERVTYVLAETGDVVYAWLAAGENADPSKYLTSKGDGTLKVAASTDIRIAKPLDTLDLTGGGAVNTRIRVRIL